MSARLLPLSDIPGSAAREAERVARAKHADRAAALDAAGYEVVDAEGCYSGAYPHTYGWLCSPVAARAVADELTHMPGNTAHHSRSVRGLR